MKGSYTVGSDMRHVLDLHGRKRELLHRHARFLEHAAGQLIRIILVVKDVPDARS